MINEQIKQTIKAPKAPFEVVPPGEVGNWPTLAARPYLWLDEPIGLYLHIPFCESKCIYCDFNSFARMEDQYASFVDALCTDITRGVSWDLPGTPDCAGAPVSTIFFGGGTPSVLDPDQIARILDAARSRYNISVNAEITMEANPGTISLERFAGYRESGINRLSMGVQVLDDVMLKKLGRIHTAQGAIDAYRWAREASFDNINLDFIYGLPGQDIDHFAGVLDNLLALDPLPEHLSCYTLIVEEHTPLYVGVMRGLITVPDEDRVAEMYEMLAERLTTAGYEQYEISNWSRPGRQCRHNLVYWHNQRYLAFGPGASGYWGTTRYSTILGPREYANAVKQGDSVLHSRDAVEPKGEMGEFMMLGLRLNQGIYAAEFYRRFGMSIGTIYGHEISALVEQGLLETNAGRVALTDYGRLLGNEVFEKFID
ncbi:MAG: radical SAM family heme chaperone HemW [Chloroflexia bacterium]